MRARTLAAIAAVLLVGASSDLAGQGMQLRATITALHPAAANPEALEAACPGCKVGGSATFDLYLVQRDCGPSAPSGSCHERFTIARTSGNALVITVGKHSWAFPWGDVAVTAIGEPGVSQWTRVQTGSGAGTAKVGAARSVLDPVLNVRLPVQLLDSEEVVRPGVEASIPPRTDFEGGYSMPRGSLRFYLSPCGSANACEVGKVDFLIESARTLGEPCPLTGRFDEVDASSPPGCARVVRPIPPRPAGVTERWRGKAAEMLRSAPETARLPNQAVTCAYARIYREDRTRRFKWAGLAAIVSRLVGEGVVSAPRVMGPLTRTILSGNRAVFDDLAWQHLAYAQGGLSQLRLAYEEGSISETVWRAWQRIDAGDPWAGNLDLLRHEQTNVLQDMYDAHPWVWWFSNTWAYDSMQWIWAGAELVSPVPGHSDYFDGNIVSLEERWNWIESSVWPAWRSFEANPENRERLSSVLALACPERP